MCRLEQDLLDGRSWYETEMKRFMPEKMRFRLWFAAKNFSENECWTAYKSGLCCAAKSKEYR